MPAHVQTKMEGALGTSFSAVRIHEGPRSEALGAQAFTQGTDIHFAPGHYQPDSQSGQELLGHELTHVVQQQQGRVNASKQAKGVGLNEDASLEAEADELGAKAARGEQVAAPGPSTGSSATGTAVQRKINIEGQPDWILIDKQVAIFRELEAIKAGLQEEDVDRGVQVLEEDQRELTIDLANPEQLLSFADEIVMAARAVDTRTWHDDRTDKSMDESGHGFPNAAGWQEVAATYRTAIEARDRAANLEINNKIQTARTVPLAKFPAVDHLQVGAGQAAIMNARSLEENGKFQYPSHLCVAEGPSLWEAPELREVRIGQTPAELDKSGSMHTPVEKFANTNKNDYARIGQVADALMVTRGVSGMSVFKASVTGIARCEETDTKGDGKWKLQIANEKFSDGNAYIYANNVDLSVGPGVPNLVTSTDSKRSNVSAEDHDELRKAHVLVYATEQLAHPTDGDVLVYGGGASGAWACEVAAAKSSKVYWVARSGDKPKVATAQNPDQLNDKPGRISNPDALMLKEKIHLLHSQATNPKTKYALKQVLDEILAFGNAALARNTGPKGAFTLDTVERVVDDLKGKNEGLEAVRDEDAITGVKVSLASGRQLSVSQVVITLGFRSDNQGGSVGQLQKANITLEPLYVDDRVVALENEDRSIRVLGAAAMDTAAFAPLIAPEERQKYIDTVRTQALDDGISDHSKSVAPSWELSAITIPAANKARRERL